MNRSMFGFVGALVVMLGVVGEAWAATRYWVGSSSTNMNDANNWALAGIPAWGDSLYFTNDPGQSTYAPWVTGYTDCSSLYITNSTGGWTFNTTSSANNWRIGNIYCLNQTSGTNRIAANLMVQSSGIRVVNGGTVWMSGRLVNNVGGLTICGSPGDLGCVVLSGDSLAYTSVISVYYGRLAVGHANALGSGGLLTFGTNLEAPYLDNVSGSAMTLAGNNPITFTTTGAITFNGSSDLNMGTGAVTVSLNRALNLNVVSNTLTIGGTIATNANTLTKNGAGTLALTGASGITNAVEIKAGALQANEGVGLNGAAPLKLNGGVLQGIGSTSFVRILGTTTGTFQWMSGGGGFSASDGQMTVNIGNDLRELTWGTTAGTTIYGTLMFGSASASAKTVFQNPVNLTNLTRTVDVAVGRGGDSAEMTGVIRSSTNAAGLVKTGGGTLILSANNSYFGPTTISNGTLTVNGTLGTNSVLVVSNAALTGTGCISGLVTVAEGALLAPGGGTGTLTINSIAGRTNLVMNGTLRLTGDASRNGSTPWLSVTGSVSIASTAFLSSTNLDLLPAGGTYTVLSFTGNREGTFSNSLPSGWQIVNSGTSNGSISIRKGYPGMILRFY